MADARGHGGSSAPLHGCRYDDLASDVVGLMGGFGRRRDELCCGDPAQPDRLSRCSRPPRADSHSIHRPAARVRSPRRRRAMPVRWRSSVRSTHGCDPPSSASGPCARTPRACRRSPIITAAISRNRVPSSNGTVMRKRAGTVRTSSTRTPRPAAAHANCVRARPTAAGRGARRRRASPCSRDACSSPTGTASPRRDWHRAVARPRRPGSSRRDRHASR